MRLDLQKMVILGRIAAPHGVRGLFKVQVFCEKPEDLASYSPLFMEDGSKITLQLKGMSKAMAICASPSVSDRTIAESLKGKSLYLPRERLPELGAQEIYQADLLGMQVQNSAGRILGEVIGLHDFGAGEIVEIQLGNSQKTEMLPYYPPFLKQVDVAARCIILNAEDAAEPEEPEEPEEKIR